MDKHYQDISITDRNFRNFELVIPRGSEILVIYFLENVINITYKIEGNFEFKAIPYEKLKNNKIVID